MGRIKFFRDFALQKSRSSGAGTKQECRKIYGLTTEEADHHRNRFQAQKKERASTVEVRLLPWRPAPYQRFALLIRSSVSASDQPLRVTTPHWLKQMLQQILGSHYYTHGKQRKQVVERKKRGNTLNFFRHVNTR